MRRRAWVAWGCVALFVAFGIVGRVTGTEAWNLLAGLLLFTALVLGVTLLPIARRLVPGLADMPDLFDRPRPNERWCATCGHPTGRIGPCRTCGATPPSRGKGA